MSTDPSTGARTNWLVPFDGSEAAIRALQLAIGEAQQRQDKPQILVLNVQLPLSADVSRFIQTETIDDYHREAADKALEPARPLLAASGLPHATHILVGPVAHSIATFATQRGCSLIIMGTRGQNSVMGMIMGSVATQLLHETGLPVLLTR